MHIEKDEISLENTSDKASSIEKLMEGSVQLGSLPTIFYQINEAVENPESSFAEIGRIISRMPHSPPAYLKLSIVPSLGFLLKWKLFRMRSLLSVWSSCGI